MHVLKGIALVSVAIVFLCSAAELASAVAPNSCSLPPPPHADTYASIFNPRQEQWLGDVEAEVVEPGLTLQPESASTYVTRIGQRLVASLPPTPIQYSFRIFDSDGVGAFALAGGRVYVSRKLLLDARNEDEVAAMLAHEIGRAYIHNSASLVTLRFEKLLDVRTVDSQADIDDKLQRLLNVSLTEASEPKPGNRDKDEMLADRVALYTLVKSGYVPEALATFLGRNGPNEGFAEDTFTELFDFESDPDVRAGQAQKVYSDLPDSCRDMRPQYRPGFKAFQDTLRDSRIDPTLPPSTGLKSIELTPPMNPALLNVRLSPDAKSVLAQDESQIHVLSVDPIKLLFSIDARGAKMAEFTPDSKSVVFSYTGLRVEDWDVTTKQRAGMLDWVDYDGCPVNSLSPDGRYFLCLSTVGDKNWFRITDLQTGRIAFQDTNFLGSPCRRCLMGPTIRWSPDARYVIYDDLETSYLASGPFLTVDVLSGKTVTAGINLARSFTSRIQFVDTTKLLYECGDEIPYSFNSQTRFCLATFPGNAGPLDNFRLDDTVWLAPVTRGPHALVGPFEGAAARVLDSATGNLGQKFKLETVDISGDTVAQETREGGLAVGKADGPTQTLPLPVTPIRSFEAADFSADGRYLALSDRARGAVWDLTAGNRVKVTHPFRNADFDSRGALEAMQIDQELKPAGIGTIDRETGKAASNFTIGATSVQIGDMIVEVKTPTGEEFAKNVDLNAIDAVTRTMLWSRHFPNGLPRVLPTQGGGMLFVMPFASETGKAEVGAHKDAFIRTSDTRKKDQDTGLLIEVVNCRTGATERLIRVPVVDSETAQPAYAMLFGNLLAVLGSHNNTTIYRETDGARLFSLFGTVLAGDGSLGLIAARNRSQELALYSATTGNRVGDWTLDSQVLAARIIPEKKQLLALTALQHVYRIDLPTTADPKLTQPSSGQNGR